MKKHSPADKAFIEAFAGKLMKAKGRYARPKGRMKVKDFAESLGVTRAALHKYVKGKARPGLDVLERARTLYGVEVKYGEVDVDLIRRRAKRGQPSDELQMLLPFAIESLKPENIQVEIAEKKRTGISLRVQIKFAS